MLNVLVIAFTPTYLQGIKTLSAQICIKTIPPKMDAIKSVENEVDKVLRLFSTCKENCNGKIDQLINIVEKSKQELLNSTDRKYAKLSNYMR